MGIFAAFSAVSSASTPHKRSLGAWWRLWLIGGTNLLVFLIASALTLVSFLEQREALIRLHDTSARQVHAQIEQQLADVQTVLLLTAQDYETLTAATLEQVIVAQPAILTLDLVGPDGVSASATESAADSAFTSAVAAASSGERYVGPSGDAADEWVVGIPVADPAAESIALVARIDAAALWGAALSVPVGDDGYIYLVTDAGELLAGPPDVIADAALAPAQLAVFTETRDGGSAIRVYRGLTDQIVVGRALAWPSQKLTAIVETPVSTMRPVAFRIIGLWGLALLLGGALGELLVRRILRSVTQPLSVLGPVSQAVKNKDYHYRVRLPERSAREFTPFEQTFNAMLAVLSGNQRELDAYATQMEEIVDQRARELSRSTMQMERAAELMSIAARLHDPQVLVARVTELIKTRFEVYHAEIWLVDKEHGQITLVGLPGTEAMTLSFHDATTSVVAWTAASNELLYVPDVTAEPRYRSVPSRTASRCALTIPLAVEGILGVLNLESDHRDAFPRDQIDVLRRLADEIAVALNNAIAFEALEQANSDLAQATLQANQANTLKSRFLYNVSQKLHTPLNTMVGAAETLLSGVSGDLELPPVLYERQRAIISNGRVMQALIEDMLDLSAIEAGHMLLNLTWVTLPLLLEEITNAARALHMTAYTSHKLDIRLDLMHLTEPLPLVWADADRLRYILINLMSNAVKFTEVGDVVLSANTDGKDIWITVRDTGPGISNEELRYLFEPFQQQRAPVIDRARGTGLGLAVSRLLAMRHGGDLTVETRRDEGTTFTLRLQCQPGGAPPRP